MLTIVNPSKAALHRAAFSRQELTAIAASILGTKYSLSLVIASPAQIQKLNLIYRDKDEPTDILSFPLSETEGEIYICTSESRREAKKFDRSYANFIKFLFIHGCVHLKGHDHGAIMESIEAEARKEFNV